jgi:hypothetical protein
VDLSNYPSKSSKRKENKIETRTPDRPPVEILCRAARESISVLFSEIMILRRRRSFNL